MESYRIKRILSTPKPSFNPAITETEMVEEYVRQTKEDWVNGLSIREKADLAYRLNAGKREKNYKVHNLKTLTNYYQAVEIGNKKFEVRFNDRDFKVGDLLHLHEFIPPSTYTGRELLKEITYILDDPQYCKHGFVVLGFK